MLDSGLVSQSGVRRLVFDVPTNGRPALRASPPCSSDPTQPPRATHGIGRLAVAIALAVTLVGAGPPVGQRGPQRPLLPADADRFEKKLALIAELGGPSAPHAPRRAGDRQTVVTEPELNAYLRFRAQAQIPVGVLEPYVWALADGHLVGVATVDLDAVRESRKRGWFDPMRLLGGRLLVSAEGVLRTAEGTAQFELQSALVSGVPIPKSMLQELVSYYSRTADRPQGIDLDAPFVLPAGIREISVRPGQAVIVQ